MPFQFPATWRGSTRLLNKWTFQFAYSCWLLCLRITIYVCEGISTYMTFEKQKHTLGFLAFMKFFHPQSAPLGCCSIKPLYLMGSDISRLLHESLSMRLCFLQGIESVTIVPKPWDLWHLCNCKLWSVCSALWRGRWLLPWLWILVSTQGQLLEHHPLSNVGHLKDIKKEFNGLAVTISGRDRDLWQ